jgi:murein DD-endopeptidase MepM/ murein hydrolase activator NlpD
MAAGAAAADERTQRRPAIAAVARCPAGDNKKKRGKGATARSAPGEQEPPRFLAGFTSGDGRQLQIQGPEFRVGKGCRRRLQVADGGGGQWFWLCRVRGNGRQGCDFHGESCDAGAEYGAGFGEQGGLVEPDAAGPGRTGCQKDNPSVADVGETRLAGDCGGQQTAQSFIQCIQRARAIRERVEGCAFRRRPKAGGGSLEGMALRHGFTNPAHCMNIIILRKSLSLPRQINLTGRRGRLLAFAVLGGCALFFVGLGAVAALAIASPRAHDLDELAALRATLAQQRSELAGLGADSQRNLDALALQLGQLQAQATRLNALGDRLTEVGKLDDGEFDFTSEPALGGPEEPATAQPASLPVPLQAGVDRLRAEFDHQEAQLDVLENLLRDRTIESALLPSGMPVAGYIASGYGARTDPIDGHAGVHLGLDLDAPMGSDIHAVADGVVTWSGQRSGYGNVVEIDHGNGYMTRYAHNSRNVVEVGTRVRAGQTIARVGSTGRSTGPHCHFEVWLNGHAVNPMTYVKAKRASPTRA